MMDPAVWVALGLPGLFVAAFLAGSVVPLPSEGLLPPLLLQGVPWPWLVLVATLGNSLGAATLFWGGRCLRSGAPRGWRAAVLRRLGRSPEDWERGRARVLRWGRWALLLSWVPLLGDGLVLAAGTLGFGWRAFWALVPLGKGLRYLALALAAEAVLRT